MDKLDLLDTLAMQQGCFVSALNRSPLIRNIALSNLSRMEENEYPLAQWQEAVCYLTANKYDFKTIGEIKSFLQNTLQ